MLRAFYRSRKWALWAYGGGALLITSLWIQVQITVAINTWYGGFYNLLQTSAEYKDKSAEGIALFYEQLISLSYVTSGFQGEPSFAVLAFPYVILAVLTGWFTRLYGFRWREAMTFDYIPRWRTVKEEIEESAASDQAKSMGLTYLKFGRYGKNGKVTHKNIDGTLTAVDKDEKPIKEPEDKKDDDSKIPADIKKGYDEIKDYEITDNNAEAVEKLEAAGQAFESSQIQQEKL